MSLTFITEFFRNPNTMGAVYPSSPELSREIIAGIDLAGPISVVEYGPGSGAVTREIVGLLGDKARFLAIEMNPRLATKTQARFPSIEVVQDSAENIKQILEERGISQLDAVISCLPWAAFPPVLQDAILGPTVECLKPGGTFVTFAYLQGMVLPSARRFKSVLATHFETVKRSRVVWANVPPAFVYRCVKSQKS